MSARRSTVLPGQPPFISPLIPVLFVGYPEAVQFRADVGLCLGQVKTKLRYLMEIPAYSDDIILQIFTFLPHDINLLCLPYLR